MAKDNCRKCEKECRVAGRKRGRRRMLNKRPESKLNKRPCPVPKQPDKFCDDKAGKNRGSRKLPKYPAPQIQSKPPQYSQKYKVRKILRRKYYDEIHAESVTRLSNRQAMVSGPTPPGTGVTAFAFFATLLKSTSPAVFPCSTEVPRSTTMAPFFIMEPLISPGIPVPEITMSAWRMSVAGFFVFRFIFITVARSPASQTRSGSPTRTPDPTRATRSPAI